jgi:hypothetical protein
MSEPLNKREKRNDIASAGDTAEESERCETRQTSVSGQTADGNEDVELVLQYERGLSSLRLQAQQQHDEIREQQAVIASLTAKVDALKEKLNESRADIAALCQQIDQQHPKAAFFKPLNVSDFGFPTYLHMLGWCMLHKTERGMPESDICEHLRVWAKMSGWVHEDVPSLSLPAEATAPKAQRRRLHVEIFSTHQKNSSVAIVSADQGSRQGVKRQVRRKKEGEVQNTSAISKVGSPSVHSAPLPSLLKVDVFTYMLALYNAPDMQQHLRLAPRRE